MITHSAYTLMSMPALEAPAVHADLELAVAPMGERHFRTNATHTANGTDYTIVRWPVRESVAAALVDLTDTYDLRVVLTPTPYATVTFPALPADPDPGIYDDNGTRVLVTPNGTRELRDKQTGASWRTGDTIEPGDVREWDGRLWLAADAHTAALQNQPPNTGAHWDELVPVEPEVTP